ncbi:MAG: hypothetical protein PHY12_04520 [Eubacteriales bacterium]|nr:hypothetical protein [Eubacteriales bacterium]
MPNEFSGRFFMLLDTSQPVQFAQARKFKAAADAAIMMWKGGARDAGYFRL